MHKKKIIATCLMTLLFFSLIWLKMKNNPADNDLALSNIEALASNEGGINVWCLGDGTIPVLFFFHPKDKRELAYLLKRDALMHRRKGPAQFAQSIPQSR